MVTRRKQRRPTFDSLDAFFVANEGLTHQWLAKQLGVNRSYISLLRSGTRQPSLSLAVLIEAQTGVPVASLIKVAA